jgi:hypothetical protein
VLCVDEVWYSPCFSELYKKYVPLVFHLDIVVIMLLIRDICYIVLCITCHPIDPGDYAVVWQRAAAQLHSP